MKRLYGILIAVVLIFGTTAYAEEIDVFTAQCEKNENTVELTVNINDVTDICGCSFNVVYDNTTLSFSQYEVGVALENASPLVNEKYSDNTVRVVCAGTEELSKTGNALKVSFSVINTDIDKTAVSVEQIKISDGYGVKTQIEDIVCEVNVKEQAGSTKSVRKGSYKSVGGIPTNSETPTPSAGTQQTNIMASHLAGFTDVLTTDWFYEPVCFVYENKLMQGVSNIEFAPNMPVTRAMFVTVLYRMEGEPEVTNENVFTDVKSGEYYEKAVIWAQGNEIVKGISETEYAPNTNITREQMAAIIYRYANFKGIDTESVMENTNTLSHNDIFKVSDWAKEAMNYCIAAGIITGDNNRNLNPQNNATRAEFATILMRAADIIK